MERASSPVRRCAVYTRKSSEEGLEQDFNSLHAQREACEAFIKSQTGEGWRLAKTAYDDGGISGGTMERPALQRLIADIRSGLIDVLVVYKVDRLTRSLTDFSKMVEVFDSHQVSFVSITQQFNTTTSMGRLTLNVLLSFAQFEREVTGERIRDKIAASKKKGIWMGGFVPLGYDLRDRRIVVNPAEAATVREIFQRYAELGSVRLLRDELTRRGIVSKPRVSRNGARTGGNPFFRGALYAILSNPIYIGEIRHGKLRHPGQHDAIVDRESWERVQKKLRDQTVRCSARHPGFEVSPLTGKLFDESGQSLTPTHAVKRERRYRYYNSRRLLNGMAGQAQGGWRLPAREIEQSVARAVQVVLNDQPAIVAAVEELGIDPRLIPSALDAAAEWSLLLKSERDVSAAIAKLVARAELKPDGINLSIRLPMTVFGSANTTDLILRRFIPMQVKRRGIEMRLVIGGQVDQATQADPSLLKVVARAHAWCQEILSRRSKSLAEIAARNGLSGRYVSRLIRLAFLDPEIVEAIAQRRQPPDLTAQKLTHLVSLPLLWREQRHALSIEAPEHD